MTGFALEMSDVHKSFRLPGMQPIEVLKGVCLRVEPGERVAIVGRSGAGKSTLLNVLGGLESPSSGKVMRPGRIGYVFQQYHLMPELTVLENVILPTMARKYRELQADARSRAMELLSRVGISDRAAHLPAELSGGEMQRVALARALMMRPELLLADEPTGNLDAQTGSEVLQLLHELTGDGAASLVMVTHSPEAAAICGRTLRLENGVLVEN